MIFTTNNVQVSLTLAVTEFLRDQGYSIYWHATDETDGAHTEDSRGIVTVVPEIPAIPAYIVRLKSEGSGSEEIVVPAFAMFVMPPARVGLRGLGHHDRDWERRIRIDMLAADEFQHRELADLLHDLFQGEELKEFDALDYDTDPASPSPLDNPLVVYAAQVSRTEIQGVGDAARYYIRADVAVRYVE